VFGPQSGFSQSFDFLQQLGQLNTLLHRQFSVPTR
jgi:hypothetical protein